MLKRLSELVNDVLGGQREVHGFDETDHRLAAAALLVHTVAIDGVVEEDEKAAVRQVLMRHFELSEEDARGLIHQAIEKDQEAVDLYGFTSVLTRTLDQPGRQKIIEMLWEIVFADGAVHEFEDNMVWRVAELMGVSRKDRLRLKRTIEQRRDGEG